jgi:hypothetical protein
MRTILAVFAVTGLWGMCGLCEIAGADEVKTRPYQLTGHGTFEMKVPASWAESVQQPPNGLPPTILFTAQSGSPFQILVSPIYPPRADAKFASADDVKELVKNAAEEASPQSVERVLEVKSIGSGAKSGFYFTATDRAPKPGEFKYLNQGMIGVGGLRVAFTILTNDGQGEIVKAALSMIISSEHR